MVTKAEIKEYDDMLLKYMVNKDIVKIFRIFKDSENNIDGFILKMSKDFLLLQVNNDFYLDGYAIITQYRYNNIRHNKFEITTKRILAKEGLLEDVYGIKRDINIKSWNDIFKELKKLDYHVIIECEDLDNPSFDIGPIKRVNKNSVSIQYYNPAGILDKERTTINYNDITVVRFGDRYSTIFRKYLKERK